MKRSKNILIYLLLLSVFLFSFERYNTMYVVPASEPVVEIVHDMSDIQESGKLRVAISSNFVDYFVYNGQPMGFYLEILEDFARDNDLSLELIEETEFRNSLELLKNGDVDLIASDVVFPKWKESDFNITIPVRETQLVLVQRKPDDYFSYTETDGTLVRDISYLKTKNLYAERSSVSFYPLRDFFLTIIDSISSEHIIRNVSEEIFDYAVCDSNLAGVLASYYSNLDISTEISGKMDVSWIVRKNSTDLHNILNNWISDYKASNKYKHIERKYITNKRTSFNITSEYYSGNEGRISIFDDMIKEASKLIDWDWRLLASLIYEESRFNPYAESWAGALGLMQLMPFTYKSFSNDTTWQISSQLLAGVKYIIYLYNLLPENATDEVSMAKMVLAGYNIGHGHVEDAIRLTEKYGKDTGSWADVSYFLENLSEEKYYTDRVVKFGYFPGKLAVNYANSVYERYLHYINIIPE